ncbi:tRNA:m(4)X modification enzyme TRM13 homolog isoform X3 [Hippocampus comes]|uniref:tRNA:m(4)X modification enzyme TRM13 homolog isoform X3 n=1 Tax=Hippocampus comes TaxID=109280 RepID=UPI00094F2F99|nr:PREDICTED: tRNA:m(4)X modification enzyme TRM13 homolog isoform X3 [Hippocampus comes]
MAAPATDRNGKCAFFVEKKKRFCKMVVAKGREFCGEHANNVSEEGGGGGGGRIVCPLDPKHTVNRNKLEAHLKKCNSRDKAKPAYYAEDINAGSPVPSQHSLQQVTLCERSAAQLQQLLDKLDSASKGLPREPEERVLSHAVFREEADNPKNGDSARKHLKQQASILGHLEALGLLRRGRCFVEFGAGRGKLSHWIHRALEGHPPERLQMLLVERSSTRFKVDGKHRGGDVEFARLHIDIQHLDLTKVPLLERRLPLVGVGKHLCGAATDLALRCLFRSRPTPGREAGRPPKRLKAEAAHPGGVAGLALALCCHHRCEWRHYVGRRFFSDLGLGPAEFSAFCRMSSWATCGVRAAPRAAGAEEASDGGLPSPSERERIGRRCKLLLDAGRVEFLRAEGFDARLTRYVGAGVTPENVLLTAAPRPPSSPPSRLPS